MVAFWILVTYTHCDMKTTRALLGLVGCIAALSLAMPYRVQAQQIRVQPDQVVVSARVLDRRTIVVDSTQNILMITSNTPKDVKPDVLFLSETGPHVPLTPSIRERYDALTAQVKDNKVFVMTQFKSRLDGLVPDFIGTQSRLTYNVVPIKSGYDYVAAPYVATLATTAPLKTAQADILHSKQPGNDN